MNRTSKIALISALSLSAITAAFLAGRARAAGVPDADVLTYTGYLEDADGAPLEGSHSIEVQFLDAADATSELCGASLDAITLQSGRFQVPLPVECVDAVKANPNLWVEVKVDGASLGPTKLGAVPFALEAGHSTSADSADAAAGALDERIAELEGQFDSPSAFRATRATAQVIPGDNQDHVVDFDAEDYDLGSEFDVATDTFTVNSAGIYLVQCSFRFAATGVVANYASNLYRNGQVAKSDSTLVDGTNKSCMTSAILKLDAGDTLTCRASQNSGDPQSLAPAQAANRRTVFEAVRLLIPPT